MLVAEELFASGCRLLLSLTSSGQITPSEPTPYFVIIDRALRDEGTSYHYAIQADYADADNELVTRASALLQANNRPIVVGPTWTTDAPFRETRESIEAAQCQGILAVEMEAAALYSFAKASGATVLCLAHVTNTMGRDGNGFEKGEADGTDEALSVLSLLVELEDTGRKFTSEA